MYSSFSETQTQNSFDILGTTLEVRTVNNSNIFLNTSPWTLWYQAMTFMINLLELTDLYLWSQFKTIHLNHAMAIHEQTAVSCGIDVTSEQKLPLDRNMEAETYVRL